MDQNQTKTIVRLGLTIGSDSKLVSIHKLTPAAPPARQDQTGRLEDCER